jgi:hypothetical protein
MVITDQLGATEVRKRGATAPLLAYFGHHKCASSWLSDITREVCAAAGLIYAHVHSPRMFQGDLRSFASRNRVDFLAYVNANRSFISALGNVRGFHVIRDPRDIVVSSYFSHLHSHPTTDWPELIEHRRQLQAVDKEQGIYVVIDFLEDVLGDIATWDYADPDVLELKMEDIVMAPDELMVRAFAFIGLVDTRTGLTGEVISALSSLKWRRPWLVPFRLSPLPVSTLVGTLGRNAYEVKANGRAKGAEDVTSHYRKGVPGDWVNHLGPGHKDYFKARYGELLIKLGYETDLSW